MSPLQRREEFSGRLNPHQPQFTEREDRGRGCRRGKEQMGPRGAVPVPDEPIDRCQREARRRDHGPDDGDPAHQFKGVQDERSVVQAVESTKRSVSGPAPSQPVYTGGNATRVLFGCSSASCPSASGAARSRLLPHPWERKRACGGTGRHRDDRGRQRHRDGHHRSGGAGRDRQPVGSVTDDSPDHHDGPGGRLPVFCRADRRPHADLRARRFRDACPRGHSRRARLYGDRERRHASRHRPRQRHRQQPRGRRLVNHGDDPLRQPETRQPSRGARHLCHPGQHAWHRDVEDGRRRRMARSPCRNTPPTACGRRPA